MGHTAVADQYGGEAFGDVGASLGEAVGEVGAGVGPAVARLEEPALAHPDPAAEPIGELHGPAMVMSAPENPWTGSRAVLRICRGCGASR
jgi:hypothetical protein